MKKKLLSKKIKTKYFFYFVDNVCMYGFGCANTHQQYGIGGDQHETVSEQRTVTWKQFSPSALHGF